MVALDLFKVNGRDIRNASHDEAVSVIYIMVHNSVTLRQGCYCVVPKIIRTSPPEGIFP